MKRFLAAALLFATPLASFAQPDSEAEARTRILLNGAEIRRELVPALSNLSLSTTPGVILTGEGLLCQQFFGYGLVAWRDVVMMGRGSETIDILVGDPLQQQFLSIPTSSTRSSSGYSVDEDGNQVVDKTTHETNAPYLQDPESFFQALVRRGGLVPDPEGRDGVYVRGDSPPPAEAPLVFPYAESEKWRRGWAPEELVKLPRTPGVTVNAVGIARVTPTRVESLRWEDVVEVTNTPADFENSQGANLELVGQTHVLMSFDYPDAFDLSPLDFQRLGELVEKGREAVETPVVFPLRTKSLQWVEPKESVATTFDATLEQLPPGANWWPSRIERAGLYLFPEGLMEVDRYVVRRVAWPQVQDLSGDVYGLLNITVHGYPLWISPLNIEEVPAFLRFRDDVRVAAGLRGTGDEIYIAPEGREVVTSQSGFYPLSKASDWRGLPLSILGETSWERGLYLLPEGLVSVEEQRIGLTAWEDFVSLAVVDTEDGHCLIHSATKGQRHGVYPPGALHGETLLKLSASEVEKALRDYVKLDPEGSVSPVRTRPTRKVRLSYLDVSED